MSRGIEAEKPEPASQASQYASQVSSDDFIVNEGIAHTCSHTDPKSTHHPAEVNIHFTKQYSNNRNSIDFPSLLF